MILNEISALEPQKQVAKIFKQYFGEKLPVAKMTPWQARHMLSRVRRTIGEHRATPAAHGSQNNPAYLKLIMIEQALESHLKSARQALRQIVEDSDVQQAQVVLAAQDMVDKVQKMIEEISEMQYKELPALVDSIRNQIGTAEADAFNQSATAALQCLVQNLQGSKTQLEQSQQTLTGQAPVGGAAPGGLPPEAGAGGAPPAPGEEEVDLSLDANLPGEEEEEPAADLGRERR